MKSEFTVKVRGGLGNQLFIFSAAIVAQKQTGLTPVFDFLDARAGIANHGNSIEPLLRDLGYKCVPRPQSRRVAILVALAERVRNRLFAGLVGDRSNDFLRGNPGWVGDLSAVRRKGGHLSGYFQSHRYAEMAGRPLELLLDRIRSSCGSDCELLRISGEFAAVHARRGDYLTIGQDLGAVDLVSQASAIRVWAGALPVVVHSDDEVYATQLASAIGKSSVFSKGDASDLHELVHLSRASKFYLTNSSFGWWAAYMSGAKEIMTPNPWFRISFNPKCLIPPNWKTYTPRWL